MKSKEWIIATKLEILYDKKEILTMYANTVDFGSNAYGIKTACKTYFNTTPSEMTAEQAAVLVGMLKLQHIITLLRILRIVCNAEILSCTT